MEKPKKIKLKKAKKPKEIYIKTKLSKQIGLCFLGTFFVFLLIILLAPFYSELYAVPKQETLTVGTYGLLLSGVLGVFGLVTLVLEQNGRKDVELITPEIETSIQQTEILLKVQKEVLQTKDKVWYRVKYYDNEMLVHEETLPEKEYEEKVGKDVTYVTTHKHVFHVIMQKNCQSGLNKYKVAAKIPLFKTKNVSIYEIIYFAPYTGSDNIEYYEITGEVPEFTEEYVENLVNQYKINILRWGNGLSW